MAKSLRIVVYLLFAATYGGVYAGWVFCQPESVVPAPHQASYYAFLGLMALPFGLPLLPALARKSAACRRILFSMVPVGGILLLLYAANAVHYYYSQVHAFDPFLQNPPPRFNHISRQKEPGTVRMLFLGGSTTNWGKLRDQDQYPSVLKTLLEQRYPGVTFEVLNGGREYYTTKHSLINYDTYCRRWKPDVVVIMHAINDLCRSFSPGVFGLGEYNEFWSHYYGPAIGAARPAPYEMVALREFFARAAERWYYALRVREMDYPLDRYLSLPDYEENLRSLVECVRRDTPNVVLVLEPSLYREDMPAEELRRLKFGKYFSRVRHDYFHQEYPSARSLGNAMQAYHAAMRRVAAECHAPVADADGRVEKSLRCFVDDVHYTPEGARQVAQVVAEAIMAGAIVEEVSKGR